MRPGVIYFFDIENAEKLSDQDTFNSQKISVELADMDNLIPDDNEPQAYEMEAADSPIVFSIIDNNEDKFTPIKSTQVTLRVLTTNNINMSTFAGGSDQRWRVHIYSTLDTSKFYFKGFLSLSDLSEEWMPNPRLLVLTASDNLGLLKNIPLTESTLTTQGNNPTGYHRIQEILAWCLTKTGLLLQLNAVFNIRAVDFPDDHFFNSQFLDVKTFEDEIGTCVNCRQVLEMILGEEAVLFQRSGEWWILRLDEIESAHGYSVSTFSFDGTFIEHKADHNFNKVIEKDNSIIFFSEELTQVVLNRPLKSVKLTFNYEFPKEIPCNVDFSRGDFVADLADETEDGITYTVKKYDIECWTLQKGSFISPTSADISAYIKRLFYPIGYEKQRYAVLTAASTTAGSDANQQYIVSESIPVNVKDRFTVSIDWRLASDISTGSGNYKLLRVILNGDDGSYWVLGNIDFNPNTYNQTDYRWYDTANWTQFTGFGDQPISFSDDGDQRDWRNLSWDAPACPIGGNLYLVLHQFNQVTGTQDDVDIYYQNLQFDYSPFVNGSYKRYDRQFHEIIRATDADKYAEKREEEVFISDAPAKLFKGALFSFNGSSYVLSGLFWNKAIFSTPPGAPYEKPYGEIQIFDVWNQFRNFVRVFQGNMQGLQTKELDYLDRIDMASLLHKWFLQDNTQHTNNKYFALLTFDQDLRNCEWKGLLKEVYDINIGKVYDDTHIFKHE